jgi:hypothetical protein
MTLFSRKRFSAACHATNHEPLREPVEPVGRLCGVENFGKLALNGRLISGRRVQPSGMYSAPLPIDQSLTNEMTLTADNIFHLLVGHTSEQKKTWKAPVADTCN